MTSDHVVEKVAADATTQKLCDETRMQYELLLQRQEIRHERQCQATQAELQHVLSSSISLAEHEKILFAECDRTRREREELLASHAHALKQLEATWRHQMQTREREWEIRLEDERNRILDQIPPLELARSDAFRLLKEQEIGEFHAPSGIESRLPLTVGLLLESC